MVEAPSLAIKKNGTLHWGTLGLALVTSKGKVNSIRGRVMRA